MLPWHAYAQGKGPKGYEGIRKRRTRMHRHLPVGSDHHHDQIVNNYIKLITGAHSTLILADLEIQVVRKN